MKENIIEEIEFSKIGQQLIKESKKYSSVDTKFERELKQLTKESKKINSDYAKSERDTEEMIELFKEQNALRKKLSDGLDFTDKKNVLRFLIISSEDTV